MTSPVNFEIAKLLKEKGVDIRAKLAYQLSYPNMKPKQYVGYHNNILTKHRFLSAPTIAEAIMWLYEKHGIWITVYTMDKWLPNGNDREQLFDYGIKQMKLGLIDIPKKPEEFNSPTNAYSEAIKHCLLNIL